MSSVAATEAWETLRASLGWVQLEEAIWSEEWQNMNSGVLGDRYNFRFFSSFSTSRKLSKKAKKEVYVNPQREYFIII